jgi:hybrid cluster-associated redox disulfide protein
MKMKKKITKDMMIGEVVREHPAVAMVMMSHGMHCVGCHVAAFETIEQGCKGHGMDDKQIDEMIEEMNKIAEEEEKKSD